MERKEMWKKENPIYCKLYKCFWRRAYNYRKKNKIDMGVTEMLGCSVTDMLGCSIEELRKHLENKWVDGMTWNNYGILWEIDHVIPLSHDKSLNGFVRLNHHNNLQPLWTEDNRKKGNKLIL